MTAYTIEIDYTTGNSFTEERLKEEIGMAWYDKDMAKEALQDIKEHHEACQVNDTLNSPKKYSPLRNKAWFVDTHSGRNWAYSIKLKTDDGERRPTHVFWEGYFEELHSAEVIELKNDDMRIEF